jgi:hypothetical protein
VFTLYLPQVADIDAVHTSNWTPSLLTFIKIKADIIVYSDEKCEETCILIECKKEDITKIKKRLLMGRLENNGHLYLNR